MSKLTSQSDWDAFDALPDCLRRAIDETLQPVQIKTPVRMMASVGGTPEQAARFIVGELRRAEAGELQGFAAMYRSRYGHAYPHVAARATIQRYMPG